MGIALGSNSINKAYLGTTEIQKMYLGANLVFDNTILPSNLKPIMTDFTVNQATPNQVHFNTPLGPVTGINFADFTISGKTINAVDTTNNYFTVSSDFIYWEQAITIRKEGGDNSVVYDFRIQRVFNLMDEPDASANKFVDVSGGGDGSEGSPWSISQMNSSLASGETAWIKAGDYGDQKISISGNAAVGNPKKIIGYKNTIGDITSMYWNYGDALDSSEMPLISGSGSGFGMALNSNYLVVRNIQVDNYDYGIDNDGEYNVWDNVLIHDTQGLYGIHNRALKLASNTLKNSTVLNAENSLIRQYNDFNLIEDCNFYDNNTTDPARADYYISVYAGSNNVMWGNHVERKGSGGHEGHGISLKASLEDTHYNLAESNVVQGINQAFEFRHSDCKYSVSRNNHFIPGDEAGVAGAMVFRDECSYCVSENDHADGVKFAVRYGDSASEDGGQQPTSHYCDVINMIGNDNTNVVLVAYTPLSGTYNRIINSTFTNIGALTSNSIAGSWSSTNEFINCIFDNITNRGSNDAWTFTNNLIWSSWATSIGSGSINVNPDLNASYQPQADFTQIIKPRIDNVFYGKNGVERQAETTIGSVLSADETASSIPFAIISYNISEETQTTARVVTYMTEQCSINYYVNGVLNASSSGDFDAGYVGPNEYRHNRVLTGLTPGITANLIIEITAQDDGEVVQSGNIPLTTLPDTPTTTDYYVSSDGTGNGLSDSTPMSESQGQTTINSLQPGESIGYKGGDTFGKITVPNRTNITITSYGTGQSNFSNLTPVTSWVNEGSNIWSSVQDAVYQVPGYKNAVSQDYNITTANGISFISTELIGHADIVGGSVWVRNREWMVEVKEVVAFNASTGEVTMESTLTNSYDNADTFKIMNHESVCDTQDEWYYSGGSVYMYSTTEPSVVNVTTGTDNGIETTGSSLVTLDNIKVEGFNGRGIDTSTSSGISVVNSTIDYCYLAGIYFDQSSGHVATNNTISNSMEFGVNLEQSDDCIVTYNTISNIGIEENYTYLHSWSGKAIYDDNGSNNIIRYNSIYNSGYNGIALYGNSAFAEYNYLENYCTFLYDGGGIYGWSNDFTSTTGYNSTIRYNTIITGHANETGTVVGVYMDDRVRNATIDDNAIGGYGIGVFLHNTKDCSINNNNIHNERYGIRILEDSAGGDGETIGNIVSNNNFCFSSNTFPETCIITRSIYDNINLYTGSNNRIYNLGWTHPVELHSTSTWFYNSEFPLPYTVADAPTETGSTDSPTQEIPFTIDSYDTVNLVANPDMSSGIAGWSTLGTGGSLSDGGGFLSLAPGGDASIIVGSNDDRITVVEGEYYEMTFDIKTQGAAHWGRLNMQMTDSPNSYARMQPMWIDTGWTTQSFLMYMDFSGTNVRFEWWNLDGANGFDLDNVSVIKVTPGADPESSFLAYNETSTAKDVALPTGTWDSIDGTVTNQTGTVNVAAYSSLIMIKQ